MPAYVAAAPILQLDIADHLVPPRRAAAGRRPPGWPAPAAVPLPARSPRPQPRLTSRPRRPAAGALITRLVPSAGATAVSPRATRRAQRSRLGRPRAGRVLLLIAQLSCARPAPTAVVRHPRPVVTKESARRCQIGSGPSSAPCRLTVAAAPGLELVPAQQPLKLRRGHGRGASPPISARPIDCAVAAQTIGHDLLALSDNAAKSGTAHAEPLGRVQ